MMGLICCLLQNDLTGYDTRVGEEDELEWRRREGSLRRTCEWESQNTEGTCWGPRVSCSCFTVFLVDIHKSGKRTLVRCLNETEPEWGKRSGGRVRCSKEGGLVCNRHTPFEQIWLRCFVWKSFWKVSSMMYPPLSQNKTQNNTKRLVVIEKLVIREIRNNPSNKLFIMKR